MSLLALLLACAVDGPADRSDPTSTTPPDLVPAVEDCANGADDDGDGQIDCIDPDCDGRCAEQCADARDNDGDGRVDCADPDCAEVCVEDCANGTDDDADGLADCADPDCAGRCVEDCTNGRDDDVDGVTDCADPDCAATCDADADGYDGLAFGGADCDDGNAAVHPGAADACGDGVDSDCNGIDARCPEPEDTSDPLTRPTWAGDSGASDSGADDSSTWTTTGDSGDSG